MKDQKHHDDGRVNRDGITQGSGHGDTFAKARDIDSAPLPESETKRDGVEEKREPLANDNNKTSPTRPLSEDRK